MPSLICKLNGNNVATTFHPTLVEAKIKKKVTSQPRRGHGKNKMDSVTGGK